MNYLTFSHILYEPIQLKHPINTIFPWTHIIYITHVTAEVSLLSLSRDRNIVAVGLFSKQASEQNSCEKKPIRSTISI